LCKNCKYCVGSWCYFSRLKEEIQAGKEEAQVRVRDGRRAEWDGRKTGQIVTMQNDYKVGLK